MSAILESVLDAQRRADCEANDAELAKPAEMKLLKSPHWKYTRAEETDITRTWRRAGWFPVMAHRRPA